MNIPSLSARKKSKKKSAKRAPFFSSVNLKGSMALEGSIVFPIFLFFVTTALLGLEVARLQSNIQQALHQAGNAYAFAGYQMKYEGLPGVDAKERIMAYLEEQPSFGLCLAGGREGMAIEDLSSVGVNGFVHLQVRYGVKPLIYWLPIGDLRFEDGYFSHGWTGYFGTEHGGSAFVEEDYVYLTKTGSKYHRSRDCVYLNIRIRAVSRGQIHGIRNDSGGKYYACERCAPIGDGMVYLASDGDRYHGRADCPSLKRTVYAVLLSKAKGYGPCGKCGG